MGFAEPGRDFIALKDLQSLQNAFNGHGPRSSKEFSFYKRPLSGLRLRRTVSLTSSLVTGSMEMWTFAAVLRFHFALTLWIFAF